MARRLSFLLISAPLLAYWLSDGYFLPLVADHLLAVYVVDGVFTVGWPILLLAWAQRHCEAGIADLGLSTSNVSARDILETTVVCTVTLLIVVWVSSRLSWALLWRIDWIWHSPNVFSWHNAIPNGPLGPVARLYLAVTAGVTEELYFRGFLKMMVFAELRNPAARRVFLLVSSAAFGAIHWEEGLARFASTAVVGFVAARLYLWTRNLWPLITAHAVVDLVFL